MTGQETICQVDVPCPKCGSNYRRGDCCNICGEFCPVSPADIDWHAKRKARRFGMIWSSKEHRYVGMKYE